MIIHSALDESDDMHSVAQIRRRYTELTRPVLVTERPRRVFQWAECRDTARRGAAPDQPLERAPTGRWFKHALAQAGALRVRRTYFNASKVNARNLP